MAGKSEEVVYIFPIMSCFGQCLSRRYGNHFGSIGVTMSFLATIITIALAFLSALATALILILRKNSKRIFGIYPIKGLCYYLKYPLALQFVRYWRRKLFEENKEKLSSTEYLQSLDKPQILSANPKSYDVVSFMGANKDGYKLMITVERRRRGITKAAFYLWIPNRGLFSSPKLPDMVHFTTDGKCESEGFTADGFHIYPLDSMRRWKVTYTGTVKQCSKVYPLKFEGEFSSKMDHFDYNKDLSTSVIADSISREVWDDQFFHLVKNLDGILMSRTHYEQSGDLDGTFQLGDDAETTLQLKATRDHSFGTQRGLSSIYRYVYISLFLDNDTNLVVGILSQPSFFLSSLKVGYICTRKTGYIPITGCNFELYSYGEKGKPPNHQNFIVKTQERNYFVQIKSEDCAIRYVGGEWESKVYNQFVSCTVDGVDGHGIVEYLYRNNTGRSNSVSLNDPEWYRRVKSFERSISNGEAVEEGVVW